MFIGEKTICRGRSINAARRKQENGSAIKERIPDRLQITRYPCLPVNPAPFSPAASPLRFSRRDRAARGAGIGRGARTTGRPQPASAGLALSGFSRAFVPLFPSSPFLLSLPRRAPVRSTLRFRSGRGPTDPPVLCIQSIGVSHEAQVRARTHVCIYTRDKRASEYLRM